MTEFERAAQIWPILALAARNRQILSYKLISKLTGLPMQLGNFLRPIAAYCEREKFPQLTVLVVNETGIPGDRYPGGEKFYTEQAKVFNFDWLEKRVPLPKDLQEAWADVGSTLKAWVE